MLILRLWLSGLPIKTRSPKLWRVKMKIPILLLLHMYFRVARNSIYRQQCNCLLLSSPPPRCAIIQFILLSLSLSLYTLRYSIYTPTMLDPSSLKRFLVIYSSPTLYLWWIKTGVGLFVHLSLFSFHTIYPNMEGSLFLNDASSFPFLWFFICISPRYLVLT